MPSDLQISSCAVSQLQKFVHVAFFSACALVLNERRINCCGSSFLFHLYVSLYESNEFVDFPVQLFNQ